MSGTSKQSTMRRFQVVRTADVSGTSGVGIVAEGVEFSDGSVCVHWISQLTSHELPANMKVWDAIHSHGGKTRVEWIDG